MIPSFPKYPTPDLSEKPVGSTVKKKSRNQWLCPSLPPPCFELAQFTRTSVMASWLISSFCSCFTISFKHSGQMLTSQILSFCSYRPSLLWMLRSIRVEAEVPMMTLFLPHCPSCFSSTPRPSASLLGAIASAFSITGILFL